MSLLQTIAAAKRYALAGKATFTLVSVETGIRFTYQVRAKTEEDTDETALWFVSVLNGPDNESDYAFLGTIFSIAGGRHVFHHGKKSKVGKDAPSAKAFAWWFANVCINHASPKVEVHHSGTCGRCNRALTVPESVATGLGPECAGMVS